MTIASKRINNQFQNIWKNEPEVKIYNQASKKTNTKKNSIQKRTRFYTLISALDYLTKEKISGDYIECGCGQGHSTYIISSILKQNQSKKTFHIFDAFEKGYSEPHEKDEITTVDHQSLTLFSANIDTVRENLNEFNSFIELHDGWIPNEFYKVKKKRFAFVNIDVNLYQSTKDSINFFWPRLRKGGVMYMDDYNSIAFPGATTAIKECIQELPMKYKLFVKCGFSGGFIIK